MIREEEVFKIGRIGKPHGIKGEVTLHIDDDENPSWSRLTGMSLVDSNTQLLIGKITSIDATTANILFAVDTADGEVLVPAAEELIEDIDWEGRTIRIALPEGLLSLNNEK